MGAKGFGANKDTEKLIRLARKQGWTVEMTRNNHVRFLPPRGGDIIIGGLTSNRSGVQQLEKRLVRAGLQR